MICIIPLRSGSKRLKDKNISTYKYYNTYTEDRYIFDKVYETCESTYLFDKIIFAVDKEYKEIVKSKLPEVEVYVRKKKNSRDESPLIDLVREIVEAYNITDKYCCIAYATSLLMTQEHLVRGYKKIAECDYHCVFPVVKQKIELMDLPDNTIIKTDHSPLNYYKHADSFFMFNLKQALDKNIIVSNTNDGFIEIGELEYQDVHTDKDLELLRRKYKVRLL